MALDPEDAGPVPRSLLIGSLLLAGATGWLEASGGAGLPRMALLGVGSTVLFLVLGWTFSFARAKEGKR